MQERLDYIFKALDDADIGLVTASRLFEKAASRVTLLNWRQGKSLPRTDFTLRIIYGYAQLIRKAVDKGLLPVKGKMSSADKFAVIRNTIRAMR